MMRYKNKVYLYKDIIFTQTCSPIQNLRCFLTLNLFNSFCYTFYSSFHILKFLYMLQNLNESPIFDTHIMYLYLCQRNLLFLHHRNVHIYYTTEIYSFISQKCIYLYQRNLLFYITEIYILYQRNLLLITEMCLFIPHTFTLS